MTATNVIDYEDHWSGSVETYKNHPTSRHRRRFIMNRLREIRPSHRTFVFDYGCGPGMLLEQIKSTYGLPDENLGGCDVSRTGIEKAREKFEKGMFFVGEYPVVGRPIDVAITSEVIEHTADYRKILTWMAENMAMGGDLILTTPGGTMDPPDEYYGHIQHFKLEQLTSILKELGLTIVVARYWGYPFFTLQKWVTKRNFDSIRDRYMHGEMDWKKKLIFTATYYAYLVHDLVPRGPQIFIHARKTGSRS
jgi:2-polyprenyl-3-methyl-5-hydroxy-6-metoxy-1,4-benzoquinol methylase